MCVSRIAMPRLTIGIPTYNRAGKLARLLDALAGQLGGGATGRVSILVSDNCSADDTAEIVAAWTKVHREERIDFVRQPENLGAPRNFRTVYDESPGDFVWLFGDDDLPEPGAVERILRALDTWDVDVLICGFEQPPGTLIRVLPAGASDQLAGSAATAARTICSMTKLTGYVLRTRVLPRWRQGDELDVTARAGFPHCVFALSILEAKPGSHAGLLSEAVAVADEDFVRLRTPVADWAAIQHTFEHSYVARHAPELAGDGERTAYAFLINILWGWRTGKYDLVESLHEEYWAELRKMRLRWRDTLHFPVTILLHFLLIVEPVHLPRLVVRLRQRLLG
jgi:Glycosyl transferase family 2